MHIYIYIYMHIIYSIKNTICTYIYIYNGVFYAVIKNNEIMLFAATWMDLEIIILNKIKSDRERQILYNITYMWNLEDRTYLQD